MLFTGTVPRACACLYFSLHWHVNVSPRPVTGIFLLSQEHSQRDQIYIFKILFNCTVTPSPNSVYTYGTRFSSTILYR